MGILEELKKLIPEERIDGVLVEDVIKHVMLDVEFTPVVYDRLNYDPAKDHWERPPMVSKVQASGSRWCVWLQDDRKYAWVDSDEALKEMRARYLLLRGFYMKAMPSLPYSTQQNVLAKFFPKGLFIPNVLLDLWAAENQKVKK